VIRSPFRQLTAACAALTLGMVVLEAGQATTGVPAGRRPPAAVDHRAILQRLDDSTLARGRELYANACAACHGTGAVASLPAARSFAGDALKYGADPYSMWQTVTYGRGMMAAQSWLTPEERYFVIQYIREAFIRPHNPSAYVPITASYLRGLPKPAREASEEEVARAAAEGLQSAGQTWAQQRRGDYGSALYSQLRGRASSALTVALDHGVHVSYDLLRMRLVAAWAGELDVSTTKFQRYRGEGMPFVAGEEITGLGVW
jgi:mono/diheme cytochrome c family protein